MKDPYLPLVKLIIFILTSEGEPVRPVETSEEDEVILGLLHADILKEYFDIEKPS